MTAQQPTGVGEPNRARRQVRRRKDFDVGGGFEPEGFGPGGLLGSPKSREREFRLIFFLALAATVVFGLFIWLDGRAMTAKAALIVALEGDDQCRVEWGGEPRPAEHGDVVTCPEDEPLGSRVDLVVDGSGTAWHTEEDYWAYTLKVPMGFGLLTMGFLGAWLFVRRRGRR